MEYMATATLAHVSESAYCGPLVGVKFKEILKLPIKW
jgi:hypothetical protein